MTQLIRPEFNTTVAGQIIRDIQFAQSNYYYYLGRVTPWSGGDIAPTAAIPLSFEEDELLRHNIIYLRRITPNDVSLVIKRYNWTSGEVYNRWDSSIDMRALPFYVVTAANRIYKCLDNNQGAVSTVEPTSITPAPYVEETADGYIWKYMYTIPAFKNYKFSNTKYVPVQRAVSDSFYNAGSISNLIITNPGVGYTTTTINIAGDGTGASFTAILSSGEIVGITTVSNGSGYSYAEITVTGDGTGAVLTPTIGLSDIVSDQSTIEQVTNPGGIYAVNLTNAGAEYSTVEPPAVVITGDGIGATAVAYIDGLGSLTGIAMVTYGTGYSYADVVIDPPIGVSSPVQATASIIKGPYNGHGYNAIEELYGSTLAISSVLNANSLLTELDQDYRQYGILRAPNNIGATTFATVDSEASTWKLEFASTTGLSVDMLLKYEAHQFVVVQFDSTYVYLQQLSSANITPVGAITTIDGLTTFSSVAVISSPTINKYSGSLMLVSNENPFAFTTEQNIALKTYIKM